MLEKSLKMVERIKEKIDRKSHEIIYKIFEEKYTIEGCVDGKNINLYWFNKVENIGDVVGPLVVERLTGYKARWAPSYTSNKLLSVGSILTHARKNDIIWGSGLMRSDTKFNCSASEIEVLSVRGPLTAQVMKKNGIYVPEVYGDPALLLPEIIQPKICEKKYKLGIIPHYADKELLSGKLLKDSSILIIDIQGKVEDFVDQLMLCDRVISSSLHGIVIAESYNIPAAWLKLSDIVVKDNGFKFKDYYYGTGREVPFVHNMDNILMESSWTPFNIDTLKIKNALIDRFKL